MLHRRLIIMGQEFCLAAGQCGKGAPTASTEGCEGATYMDTDTKKMYKCTKCEEGAYVWEPFTDADAILYTEQNLTPEQQGQARKNIGIIGNGFFTLAVDEDGNLWAYSEEGAAPAFEYDSETGNLYVVQEQE